MAYYFTEVWFVLDCGMAFHYFPKIFISYAYTKFFWQTVTVLVHEKTYKKENFQVSNGGKKAEFGATEGKA